MGEVSFVILFKDDQARAPIFLLFKRLLLLRGALSNVPARTRSVAAGTAPPAAFADTPLFPTRPATSRVPTLSDALQIPRTLCVRPFGLPLPAHRPRATLPRGRHGVGLLQVRHRGEDVPADRGGEGLRRVDRGCCAQGRRQGMSSNDMRLRGTRSGPGVGLHSDYVGYCTE